MQRTYERIAEKILLSDKTKSKPIGRLLHGHFVTGTASKHRTKASRQWRLFWRIKMIGKT
jgi:hypothetical protein